MKQRSGSISCVAGHSCAFRAMKEPAAGPGAEAPCNHRAPCGRKQDAGAFTLIEFVMVLAIVGILAAVAAPRFTGAAERYRVRMAADRVMRDINYTRSRALSLGAQQTITFADNTKSFSIAGMANPDNSAQTYTVKLTSEPYRVGKMTVDFGGSPSLVFNGFGVPSAGGTVTVQSGRFAITVTVTAGSGTCSIGAVDGSVTPVQMTAD